MSGEEWERQYERYVQKRTKHEGLIDGQRMLSLDLPLRYRRLSKGREIEPTWFKRRLNRAAGLLPWEKRYLVPVLWAIYRNRGDIEAILDELGIGRPTYFRLREELLQFFIYQCNAARIAPPSP